MEKKIYNTDKAPAPVGPYNQAALGCNLLFLSGQIAIDPSSGELISGDIQKETGRVMENIGAVLQAAGLDFSHLLKCSIFVTDIMDYGRINEVYAAYFDEETAPARELVQVAGLPKGANVEISAIALKPSSR